MNNFLITIFEVDDNSREMQSYFPPLNIKINISIVIYNVFIIVSTNSSIIHVAMKNKKKGIIDRDMRIYFQTWFPGDSWIKRTSLKCQKLPEKVGQNPSYGFNHSINTDAKYPLSSLINNRMHCLPLTMIKGKFHFCTILQTNNVINFTKNNINL